MLASDVVDMIEIVLGAKEIKAGQHLAAVDRARVKVDFKHSFFPFPYRFELNSEKCVIDDRVGAQGNEG